MTLHERIAHDLKEAMKARNALTLNVLRALKSALKYGAIEKLGAVGELTETDAVAVVRKQLKQRRDSLESFTAAGRADLAEKEQAEIAVLENYLPAALTEAQIQALVEAAVTETGASGKADMGKVMKLVQERAAGQADGKALSSAVSKRLS